MSLEINTSIKWSLHFPQNKIGENGFLTFEQPLFSDNDAYDSDGLALLNMLQEVFYVTHLDNLFGPILYAESAFDSNPDDINLNDRDIAWNVLGDFWGGLYGKIHNNYNLIINNAIYENKEALLNCKGINYVDFIRYNMGGVFLFRYEVFSSLKALIPWSLRHEYNVTRCTDIVCDGIAFQNFFNRSLQWIEKKQRDLQTFEGEALEKLIKYLYRRYGSSEFKRKYIKGIGCFSKTLVLENDRSYTNVLCFSGSTEPDDKLKSQIDKIANCGYFGKHYVVNVSGSIKYFLSKTEIVTHAEALLSSLYNPKNYGRMFSCCERKTFAGYDLNNCIAFRMVVRYAPCDLCKPEVDMYDNNFNRRVIPGKPTGSIARLDEYNELANKIYKMFHPLLLPYHNISTI